MLAVAERLGPAIEWRNGVGEAIPYEDDSFDAVVSQFALGRVRGPMPGRDSA